MRYRIDVETLRRDEQRRQTLELNDLARVQLELSSPLVFDSYRRNRLTGSLIVIDEATNDTVAAGVILDTEVEDAASAQERAQPERPLAGLAGDAREALAARSATAARRCGSPACRAPASRPSPPPSRSGCSELGRPAFLLDGDNLRHGLNGDLGFDEAARTGERAAHRPRRPPAGRVGHGRAGQPRQPLRGRPPDRCDAARERRARVHRGVRRRAARAVRGARPEGPLRAGARGRARRSHRRGRAVRAAREPGSDARQRRRNGRARRSSACSSCSCASAASSDTAQSRAGRSGAGSPDRWPAPAAAPA